MRRLIPPLLLLVGLTGCEYVRLLRPNVLKQLNPRVVRFVNFLPEVDHPNEAIVARLAGHGGLSHARIGSDGVMRVSVVAPPDQFIWEPALIVMPRGGVLEVEVNNPDQHGHAMMLPDNGDRSVMELPARSRGTARVELDQPGLYTFSCPVGNHAGRGMIGFILVRGEVPAAARLDRPALRRP